MTRDTFKAKGTPPSKVENNEDNREKLAEEVVDSWDMECLLEYARTSLVVQYRDEDEDFQRDWKVMNE